jgi:hypothetical protein
VQGTDSGEISTLRGQIAAAEAAIKDLESRTSALDESGSSAASEIVELGELVEARDFMVARLSRLQSCKRRLES